MSYDRFVRWQSDSRPSREEVGQLLEDFLGSPEVGRVHWNEAAQRYVVDLFGPSSHPLRRTHGDEWQVGRLKPVERQIEVVVYENGELDVLTRLQDEYTSALADRLATIFARGWNGVVDDPLSESD